MDEQPVACRAENSLQMNGAKHLGSRPEVIIHFHLSSSASLTMLYPGITELSQNYAKQLDLKTITHRNSRNSKLICNWLG